MSGLYFLKACAIQGGSKGTILEHPPMTLDQDYPKTLADGTQKEALDGVWVDGIVPGNRLQRGGMDEIHFLCIATGVGGQSPTNF